VLPELAGIGATPLGAGDFADELGGDQWPEPRLVEQLRRDPRDDCRDLTLELADRERELA
jgi:hypothetical protein